MGSLVVAVQAVRCTESRRKSLISAYSGWMSGEPITWMSTGEAAEYLGLTPRTLYRLIDEDELVAYRFGRVIRLKQSDVDAFIDGARIKPGELEHLRPPEGKPAPLDDAIDDDAVGRSKRRRPKTAGED